MQRCHVCSLRAQMNTLGTKIKFVKIKFQFLPDCPQQFLLKFGPISSAVFVKVQFRNPSDFLPGIIMSSLQFCKYFPTFTGKTTVCFENCSLVGQKNLLRKFSRSVNFHKDFRSSRELFLEFCLKHFGFFVKTALYVVRRAI